VPGTNLNLLHEICISFIFVKILFLKWKQREIFVSIDLDF